MLKICLWFFAYICIISLKLKRYANWSLQSLRVNAEFSKVRSKNRACSKWIQLLGLFHLPYFRQYNPGTLFRYKRIVHRIWQILKRFSRLLSWAQTSYFLRVWMDIGLIWLYIEGEQQWIDPILDRYRDY